MPKFTMIAAGVMALALMGVTPVAAAQEGSPPQVLHDSLDAQLDALPRVPPSQRKIVTIYQFRSGVPGVANLALTDMFTHALMESGAFLVAERQRLSPDIAVEKTLNANGQSAGNVAQQPLAAAQYIFEGTVSEANANASSGNTGMSIGGMSLGHSHQRMQIAIDVRVVDAASGLVMDSVAITKDVRSKGSSIGSIGALAQSVAGPIPLDPDIGTSSSHDEGVDRALRSCIDAAVLELVRRYGRASG